MLAVDVCVVYIYCCVVCCVLGVRAVLCVFVVHCVVCVVLYILYLCVNVINVNMPVCMCIQLMTVHACTVLEALYVEPRFGG